MSDENKNPAIEALYPIIWRFNSMIQLHNVAIVGLMKSSHIPEELQHKVITLSEILNAETEKLIKDLSIDKNDLLEEDI